MADLREGPPGGGGVILTLIIAMTGRNALSIELIKPTGEQAIVSYSLEEILKHEWHID